MMKKLHLFGSIILLLAIFLSTSVWASECIWSGVERIVAVGDVHGDYDQFVKVLKAAKVINDNNEWIAGKTHLVQTGDIPDRGPDSKKAMDLLMDLEQESLIYGGRVHALIGNHEAMNIQGDLRFTHPGEIESHGGKENFTRAMEPTGKYGKWICSHNAIIKINETLFLHGGISAEFAGVPLRDINQTIRRELRNPAFYIKGTLTASNGPLWYRGLAKKDEKRLYPLLDKIFKAYDALRIVIGHTVTIKGIKSRCKGRIIMIDVGLSKHYGGPVSCLLIENNQCYAVCPDSKKVLLSYVTAMDIHDYLTRATVSGTMKNATRLRIS